MRKFIVHKLQALPLLLPWYFSEYVDSVHRSHHSPHTSEGYALLVQARVSNISAFGRSSMFLFSPFHAHAMALRNYMCVCVCACMRACGKIVTAPSHGAWRPYAALYYTILSAADICSSRENGFALLPCSPDGRWRRRRRGRRPKYGDHLPQAPETERAAVLHLYLVLQVNPASCAVYCSCKTQCNPENVKLGGKHE